MPLNAITCCSDLLHKPATFSVIFKQQQKMASVQDSFSQYFSIQPCHKQFLQIPAPFSVEA